MGHPIEKQTAASIYNYVTNRPFASIPLWKGQVKKELLSLSFLLFATTSTYLIFMVGSITGRPVGNFS